VGRIEGRQGESKGPVVACLPCEPGGMPLHIGGEAVEAGSVISFRRVVSWADELLDDKAFLTAKDGGFRAIRRRFFLWVIIVDAKLEGAQAACLYPVIIRDAQAQAAKGKAVDVGLGD